MTATVSFIVYALIVILIAARAASKPQTTPEEIHLGGREHGVLTSAFSSSASTESGFVLLGMVGVGYTAGANAFWIVPAGIFGYLLNWLVLGPKLRSKSIDLKVLTMPEFIAASTGGGPTARIAAAVASLLALVFLTVYASAQFSAAGKALSAQFAIPTWTAMFIGAGLVAAYALVGGFRAVSWTDNVQALMMLFALVVLPSVIVISLGGLGAVVQRLEGIDPRLTSITGGATGTGIPMAILPWLMLGLAYPGQPPAVARLMAARDQRVLRSAAGIAVAWFVLIYAGAVLLGMAARAGFADVGAISRDPESILPVLALQFLPGAVAGIAVAAVMAAICSTADSTLLSAATTVVRDLRAALRGGGIPDDAGTALSPADASDEAGRSRTTGLDRPRRSMSELTLMRAVMMVLVVAAVAFALREATGNVFGLVLDAWSGLGASLAPVTLYCALARKPQSAAALAGLLVGGGLAFAVQGHPLNLLIGFGAGLAALAVVHFAASRYTDEGLPAPATRRN